MSLSYLLRGYVVGKRKGKRERRGGNRHSVCIVERRLGKVSFGVSNTGNEEYESQIKVS